jgi:uncharacterized protein YqgC (DUF456 family)
MSMPEWIGLVVAGVVMLIGLAGSVLPGIPGAPLMFVAAVVHKIIFREHSVSYVALGLLLFLALLSMIVDFLASTLGAKKMGASWRGITGAMIGAIVGLFFSLPGLILGPVIGAFLFEMLGGREWKESARAGAGAMIGFFIGALGKVICCSLMLVVFFFSVIWNSGTNTTPPGKTIVVQAHPAFTGNAAGACMASVNPFPLARVSSHSA